MAYTVQSTVRMERAANTMRNDPLNLRRWVHVPDVGTLPPILVAVIDPAVRIELSAALVGTGLRILIARSALQARSMMRAAEIMIADGRLLGELDLRGSLALRGVALIAIADGTPNVHAVAAELGAMAVFATPLPLDGVIATALDAYALSPK